MVGRIVEYSRSLEGKPRVTFEVDAIDEIRGMEDKEIILEAKISRNKRSLNANAYFHVLVGKIADKMRISKARAKNMLIGMYGQHEIEEKSGLAKKGWLIISVIDDVDMMEREDIHCVAVGYGEVNGKKFTHWAIMRPTHEYNTYEMGILIDCTVEMAKELGIETLSPAELERMKAAWHTNQ